MPIEIVYFNTPSNAWLENRLSRLGTVGTSHGEDKRSFLIALSVAVGKCKATVTVGSVSALVNTLSRGLGLPLAQINWEKLGLSGEDGAVLPQGALPLIVDGSVYGMIIESAAQCIIAIDDDEKAVQLLTDTYVLPYIQALTGTQSDGEAAQPDETAEPVKSAESETDDAEPVESAESEADNTEPVESTESEADNAEPAESAENEADDSEPYTEPEIDLFADIADDIELLDEAPHKKHHSVLITLLCILLILVIGCGGGWAGYTYWWIPRECDKTYESMREMYTSNILVDAATAGIPSDYSLKFTQLYKTNTDIISWLTSDQLGINLPVVTSAARESGYYTTHTFDGKSSKYGTPFIRYAYDTASNVNPNLVVYGNNTGDGRMFSNLEGLLNESSARDLNDITTDSVLFGEDSWQVFSVMLLDTDNTKAKFDYASNFKGLSVEQRLANVKTALAESKVFLGFTDSDFDGMSLTDSFLTLVTPYSTDPSMSVVVMARRVVSGPETVIEPYIPDNTDSLDSSGISSSQESGSGVAVFGD